MEFDPVALFFLALTLLLSWISFKWTKRFLPPSFKFPSLEALHLSNKKSFKTKIAHLPKLAFIISLMLLSLGFIDPHYFALKKGVSPPDQKPPDHGIAIYLVADESGSMMEKINAKMADGRFENIAKIDFLKDVTIPFIHDHPNDLIGLIAFARNADVRTPLTLDHNTVIEEISALKPSILQEDAGTAMGYAVFKTANLIIATKHFANELIKTGKPAYEIKNAIIVVITDGVQNVNPEDASDPFLSMDIAEGASYAKKNDIRLYIINVDPSILTSKFTPERNLMTRVAEMTGGHFYVVDSSNSLSDIYNDINAIEKSEIPPPLSKDKLPAFYTRISFYPYLIAVSLALLFFGCLLETLLLKRVP